MTDKGLISKIDTWLTQLNIRKANNLGNFPGGPVAKTPCFQCRGSGFDPWSEN